MAAITGEELCSGEVVIGSTAGASTGEDLSSAAVLTGEYSSGSVFVNFVFFCSVDRKYCFSSSQFLFSREKNSRGEGQVYKNVITKLK